MRLEWKSSESLSSTDAAIECAWIGALLAMQEATSETNLLMAQIRLARAYVRVLVWGNPRTLPCSCLLFLSRYIPRCFSHAAAVFDWFVGWLGWVACCVVFVKNQTKRAQQQKKARPSVFMHIRLRVYTCCYAAIITSCIYFITAFCFRFFVERSVGSLYRVVSVVFSSVYIKKVVLILVVILHVKYSKKRSARWSTPRIRYVSRLYVFFFASVGFYHS